MAATLISSFLHCILIFLALSTVSVDSFAPCYPTRQSHIQGLSQRSFSLNDGLISPITDVASVSNVLTNFLQEARELGAVRFVVVGTGAILETVGSFENMRFSETTKGSVVTFSSGNPVFECHIILSQVKEVQNIVVVKFEKKLRVTRFLGKDGTTLLSAVLQPEDRQECMDKWDSLTEKYGGSFKFA